MLKKLRRRLDRVKSVFRSPPPTRSPERVNVDFRFTNWNGLKSLNNLLNIESEAFRPLKDVVDRLSNCVKTFEPRAKTHQEYAKLGTDMNDLFHILAQQFDQATPLLIGGDNILKLARGIDAEMQLLPEGEEGEEEGLQEHDVAKEHASEALNLCEYLENSGKPIANFFCSRTLPECRDVNRILPNISYQLARFSRPFRCEISSILGHDSEPGQQSIEEQFKTLVADPLRKLGHSFGADVVILIDGLDQCEHQDGVDRLLKILLEQAYELPAKFIVASRLNSKILGRMRSQGGGLCQLEIRLDELDHEVSQQDIRTYLKAELEHLSLPTESLELLVQRSGVLFIYATALVRYLSQDCSNLFERSERLGQILHAMSPGPEILYASILENLLANDTLNDDVRADIVTVIRTTIYVQEPLTINAIAHLRGLDFTVLLHDTLLPLLPMLQALDANGLMVSFDDLFAKYLLNQPSSSTFHLDAQECNTHLAQACFDLINAVDPPFNVCNLESSYLLDCEVMDIKERLTDAVPSELLYACRYWDVHLRLANGSGDLLFYLDNFLSTRLLLWMEVMNLKRCMRTGIETLRNVYMWLQKVGDHDMYQNFSLMSGSQLPASSARTKNLIHDARMFATAFLSNKLSCSTPHIYISALQFWPRHRPISECYAPRLKNLVTVTGGELEWHATTIVALNAGIYCASHSPGNPEVVVGTEYGDIYILDTCTGKAIGQPFLGHTNRISSVAYSPDGKCIVSGSFDRTVRIWDAYTGYPIGQPLEGHTDTVSSAVYSPDGKTIFSGSYDNTLRIWNARTGQQVGLSLKGHTGQVSSVTCSPDGAYIVSGDKEGTIRFWNAHTRQPIGQPAQGHTDRVHSVRCPPDGTCVMSCCYNGTICIWNAHTGQLLRRRFGSHSDMVLSAAYSPNGAHIASACKDGTVRICDASALQPASQPLEGHTHWVTSVTYSPDGAYIVSSCSDGTIRIRDALIGQSIGHSSRNQLPRGHTSRVNSVAYSPDGANIASGSDDNTIRIWDAHTGQPISAPLQGHTSSISSVAYSPDGAFIVSGSYDKTICIWDANTGRAVGQPLYGHMSRVNSVVYSPGGTHIASGSRDGSIRMWDAHTGRPIGQSSEDHTGWVNSVAYSPDGAYIASGSDDNTIRVWDAYSGQSIRGSFKGHTGPIKSITYSPDGAFIASGSSDLTIRIWNAHTGRPAGQPLHGHSDQISSLVYSPDGAYVVSGSRDGSVRMWDVHTGQPVGQPLQGQPLVKSHRYDVFSVAYSPISAYIVSGAGDGTVWIWPAHACLEAEQIGFPIESVHSTLGHFPNTSQIFSGFAKYITRSNRKLAHNPVAVYPHISDRGTWMVFLHS
ncbi:hypothetical protein FRC07_012958 [Ceratobasidium sp. 392]|nr:hypothetical protein FRC07_012958 [Ceratobasidium sp. 392]